MSDQADRGDQKTPGKVTSEKTAGARQPPWETLDVSGVLVRARALLKGKPTAEEADKWARRLTRLEDWLELDHPRDDRTALRDVRRQLESKLR